MKLLLVIVLIFSTLCCASRNYYFDPSSSAPVEAGTILEPWKTFESFYKVMDLVQPGDSLLLKRGELFFEPLDLKVSGTDRSTVVISGYGPSAARPVFMFRPRISDKVRVEPFAIRIRQSKYVQIHELAVTDDHLNPLNHAAEAFIKIAIAIEESNYIQLRGCEISLVGIGVNIVGNNNIIQHCDIKNLRMVRNTADNGTDDYGANAIVLAGADNLITECTFKDCWANSFDFEFDGGAIEMAGSSCKRNHIKKNFALNCNGFMEFGSTDGGIIGDNIVESNTILNCSDALYINNDGPYAVTVQNLHLQKNIFIQLFPQLTKPTSMISMRKLTNAKDILIMRQNIFWLPLKMDIFRKEQFSGGQLIHDHNVFYLQEGDLNFTPDNSDRILTTQSPEIISIKKQLSGTVSLYPFKFLLQYWRVLF